MVKRKVGAILVIVGMQLLIFGLICSQRVYICIGLGNQYILVRALLSTFGILFMILGNALYSNNYIYVYYNCCNLIAKKYYGNR